jgi:FkbM family methyltransferase
VTGTPTMSDLSDECRRVLDVLPGDGLSSGLRIALYGTGFLGQWAVDFLRRNGVEPAACFDSNPRKHGQSFRGVPVYRPEDLSRGDVGVVLVSARHAVRTINEQLERHGVRGCSLDGWYAASNFTSFADIHDSLLADDRSRATLRAVLMTMLTGNSHYLQPVYERDQYFCLPHFIGTGKESYVDAGSYVGDSIERFIWINSGLFSRIRAFEPSPRQFTALQQRCRRLVEEWALDDDAIELNKAGLAAKAALMSANTASGQLPSTALEESSRGDIVTVSLDEHLAGDRVTFIKADVEGMEMDLLAGAAGTISAFRPKLAICVYHYPSDIPDIVARIRSLVPEYRFALRHHSPQLMETVLYCWVD